MVKIHLLGNKRSVEVAGQAGPECDATGKPGYSFDGKHMAYGYKQEGKSKYVLDGQTSPEFDELIWYSASPASFDPDGTLEYLAIKDGNLYRIRQSPPRK